MYRLGTQCGASVLGSFHLGTVDTASQPFRGEGSDKTFGGQSTYVLQLPGNRYLFMADIWRPKSLMLFGISLDSGPGLMKRGCLILPFPANAIRQMVVDKPRSLQMGIANGRAEELESPFFHVFAHGI